MRLSFLTVSFQLRLDFVWHRSVPAHRWSAEVLRSPDQEDHDRKYDQDCKADPPTQIGRPIGDSGSNDVRHGMKYDGDRYGSSRVVEEPRVEDRQHHLLYHKLVHWDGRLHRAFDEVQR